MFNEKAVAFDVEGERLCGITHQTDKSARTGVLIIVGGPQYRVGSHRQFVHLARALAAQGIPVMRFDVTGMGDSSGRKNSFDSLDKDVAAAIDCFMSATQSLEQVVLWGLCDGASAALMYGHRDPRVNGLVLVNPWLENSQAKAQARVSQYYLQRLVNVDFWRKLIKGEARLIHSLKDFIGTLKNVVIKKRTTTGNTAAADQPYQQRMLEGLEGYSGPVLIVLSGRDLTAREFNLQLQGDQRWAAATGRKTVSVEHNADADHTFSSRDFKGWVAARTQTFVSNLIN